MSEQTPEPTTASDLHAGGDKPGTDYGASGGIGTAAEEESAGSGGTPGGGASGLDGGDSGLRGGGSDPGGDALADGGGAGPGSDLHDGAGGSDPGNGAAVPDEDDAAAAQGGVQQAFSVAPQD